MVLAHPKRLWALGKPNLPCKKAGARLHDRRRTRGHAALRGEGHSWTLAKSTQRPLPRPSSFIIANIYQIFLVYHTYYAPYRSVLINSVIGCYISTSQIKHGHYILGIIISISHFFSIVLWQGPPRHLHLSLCNKHNILRLFYSIFFSSSWIASFVAHLIKNLFT